jgi:hypothetical protein
MSIYGSVFEPLKLLNVVPDPDPDFKSNADPDPIPASKNNADLSGSATLSAGLF